MKICSKCKVEKPFEAFHRDRKSISGYMSACAECVRLRRLELKKNPLKQLEKEIRSSVMLENKLLKIENKKLCTGCKEIFLIDDLVGGFFCAECERKRAKEYRKNNKGKVKENRREYYINNKEKMNEYAIKHYINNKEKVKENRREYYEKNKKKLKEYQREYKLKKKLEMQNNT